jgi:hypothetical protein
MVLGVLDGSFTDGGRRQTLVLFLAGHCGTQGFHSENYGERLVVLIENDARLATFVDDTAPSGLYKIDLNHDGTDEVLAWGGFTGAGGSSEWVELQSYAGTRPRTLGQFETGENACDFAARDYTASIVRGRWDAKASSPCFLQRKFTLRCPAVK